MRYLLKVGTLLCAATLASSSFAQDTPEDASAALAQKWIEGWNNGDMASVAALYTEDGDLLGSSGHMARGRAEIESYLTELKAGALAGATLSIGEPEIRCVSENTCVSDNTYELSGGTTLSGLTTIVMVKQEGTWLIGAHRSRVPIPSAQ